jgi:putative heme transporter
MRSTWASAPSNGNRGFAPGVVRAGIVAWHLIGIALAVLLAGWVAGRLMPVLLPVGIAVLLSALLRPLAAGLERRGSPLRRPRSAPWRSPSRSSPGSRG